MGINESELNYYLTEILINNNGEKLLEERMKKYASEEGNQNE